MFMGPLDASIAWSETGLDGARRFLDRAWRLIVKDDGTLTDKLTEENEPKLEKLYHQTVKKVTEDYETLGFNTAISQLMVFVNEGYKTEKLTKDYIDGFVKLLAPIAPHIAEELWEKLGHEGTVAYVAWPTFDETKLVDDEVEIVVQVNGKVRSKMKVAKDITKEQLEQVALGNEKIKDLVEGKTIRKVIAVPGRLVNIVAN